MPRWRQFLVDIGLAYLGLVLPGDKSFRVEYEPAEKTWSVRLLEEDARRKAKEIGDANIVS